MDNNIIDILKNELKIFDNITINSIHHDKDICFRSNEREILYAIQNCFFENCSNNMLVINFKESVFGKALVVKKSSISSNINFKNLIKYYQYYYFERLKYIENNFIQRSIDFKELANDKKLLISNEIFDVNKISQYFILKKLRVPNEIIRNILSYIIFDYKSYVRLRKKYEILRNKYK